jgi:hypothetical protein
MIWIISFSGNKTGKWSSIPASVSDIHGHKLEEVESTKYLGVTIQKNLSWNIHIDQNKKGELH